MWQFMQDISLISCWYIHVCCLWLTPSFLTSCFISFPICHVTSAIKVLSYFFFFFFLIFRLHDTRLLWYIICVISCQTATCKYGHLCNSPTVVPKIHHLLKLYMYFLELVRRIYISQEYESGAAITLSFYFTILYELSAACNGNIMRYGISYRHRKH
jgi:hypothetical protein